MQQSPKGRVTVELGPSTGQLFSAFVWVGLGLVLAALFLVVALASVDPIPGSLVIGVIIAVLSVASGVLEFLNLPGARVTLDAKQVLVQPRRGDTVAMPLAEVGHLRVERHFGGQADGGGAQDARFNTDAALGSIGKRPVTVGFGFMPRRRCRRDDPPGWRLIVQPTMASSLDARSVPIGAHPRRLARLRVAAERFGVRLLTE